MSAPIVANTNFIVDVKTAIVKGLRNALDNVGYPDPEIKGLKISMEYPMEQNQYPHIWVNFSLTKLTQAGIGHISYHTDEVGNRDGVINKEFMFEGTVTLTILALSSLQRDILASQLVQMLAFRDLNPIASIFDEYLETYPNLYMTIDKDTLVIQGQETTFGTPWDDAELAYSDGYAFKVIGQVQSNFHITPAVLSKIVVLSKLLDGETNPVTEYDITESSVTPGTWV